MRNFLGRWERVFASDNVTAVIVNTDGERPNRYQVTIVRRSHVDFPEVYSSRWSPTVERAMVNVISRYEYGTSIMRLMERSERSE